MAKNVRAIYKKKRRRLNLPKSRQVGDRSQTSHLSHSTKSKLKNEYILGRDWETRFAEHPKGSPPPGWTKRHDTADYNLDIVEGGDGNEMQLDLTTPNSRTAAGWTDIGNKKNVDILVKVRWGGSAAYCIGPAARISGDAGAEYGYVLFLEDGLDRISLYRYDNGVSSGMLDSYNFSLTAGNYYWVRFRAREDKIKAKIWLDGNDEPESWQLEYTDPSPLLTAGETGVGTFSIDGFVDYIGVNAVSEMTTTTTTTTTTTV